MATKLQIKHLRLLILLLTAFTWIVLAPFAFAHPLDEIDGVNVYDQTHILKFDKQSTRLTIDLKFYAIEKIRVWESIDTNRDQHLTQEEKHAWLIKGIESSYLEFENQHYTFEPETMVIQDYFDFFAPSPAGVQLVFTSFPQLSPGSEIVYNYNGKDRALKEIDFNAYGTNNLKVDGKQLITDNSVRITLVQGVDTGGEILGLKTEGKLNDFLNKYIKADKLAPNIVIVALGVSFILGFLHAKTPGHGKAMVASYLVGEKGTIIHAVQLGLIITVTHTFSVFLLGIAALFLTEYIVPGVVINFLNKTSGALIVIFGVYLFVKRIKKLVDHRKIHAANMPHDHDHGHIHDYLHPHKHQHNLKEELQFKHLLPLGISGGIVPCIDALAILIVAVSLQKVAYGLIVLVAFSAGLASALIAGGILVVVAKQKAISKVGRIRALEKYSSVFSALFIIAMGIALIVGL